MSAVRSELAAHERLVEAAQELSMARQLPEIMAIVRTAARALTGADGATFVLRDGNRCFYADEDAISPLWKGLRFPLESCISGWTMMHCEAVVIQDIYADPRIPHEAYRPTFVRSMAMVPIRTAEPVGAIGNYWATPHAPTAAEVKLLRALADLTSVAMENVQLYEELQKRIRQAEEAVATREEFISLAAHELRTPLTALQLQLQGVLAVEEQVPTSKPLQQRVGRAIESGRRLASLVEGLLDVSLISQRPLSLHPEPLELGEVVRQVVARFEPAAAKAGCQIELRAGEPVRGQWDRLRIEQVLTNLLSNALKYGVGCPISVRVDREEDQAILQVRDRGPGIAPETRERIFQRFGRAGPVAHYGGLGLGLYLARQAIEAHGGNIRVENEASPGAAFTVLLPLQTADLRA